MNQGFGLNYNTNFYMVRDSGHVPPGMDCLQLQLQPHQLRTQPFHYLINEQAKSLLALQTLQNEVGALLEFRDLVMETFPNLRHKMSGSNSQTFSSPQNYCSNIPLPLSGSLNSRHWEPGIKVKRKIVNKAENENSFGRVRSNSHGSKIQSSQPKSSEAISGVQDSGFSTETNSSNKDHASSTATSVPLPVGQDQTKDCPRSEYDRSDEELSEDGLVLTKANEAEEELWNLLDVIHTKGTKLREEVETLQLRLVVDEIENHLRNKELKMRKAEKRFRRRCRSLDNIGGWEGSIFSGHFDVVESSDAVGGANFKLADFSLEENVFGKKRTRSIELEDVDRIRQERSMLLEKLAEMESENVANQIKTRELQNEIRALITTKEELQEQLVQAVNQKTELNSKIHELHMRFVTGDKKLKSGNGKPEKVATDSESSQSSWTTRSAKTFDDTQKISSPSGEKENSIECDHFTNRISLVKNLGNLDGVMSEPARGTKKGFRLSESSRKKLAAILKERNYLELQRHLLISIVQNQILSSELETSAKFKDDLFDQLDRYKKENEELLFQLEERNIELEGTKAQVRVLEKFQHQSRTVFGETRTEGSGKKSGGENFTFLENDHLRAKGFSESEISRARQIFLESQSKKLDKTEVVRVINRAKSSSSRAPGNELNNNSFDLERSNNVIPVLALPLPAMASHQSSGTESTHALEISSELEADMERIEKCDSLSKADKSPCRRRPSKIPLNVQKTSKSLRSASAENSSSYLKKSDGELNKSLKKCSLDNGLQNSSIMLRSPSSCQTPLSIKYSSVGRTGSQLSIASHKSQTSSPSVAATAAVPAAAARTTDKKKSLTYCQREESSLSSPAKNPSLKPSANFSQVRQRDTLTRKNQQNDSWDGAGPGGAGNKRTLRSSFRDSFRGKISIDGNASGSVSRRDGSLSAGRKDSFQGKQNRTNSAQQKTIVNKTNMSGAAEGGGTGDNTKLTYSSPKEKKDWKTGSENRDDKISVVQNGKEAGREPDSSDYFVDSLNSPIKMTSQESGISPLPPSPPPCSPPLPSAPNNLFDVVRESFQKKLAEKFSRTFFGASTRSPSRTGNVWEKTKMAVSGNSEEASFFDSIDDSSLSPDEIRDSLLLNLTSPSSSSLCHWNKSMENEAMAELDSLEMKFN